MAVEAHHLLHTGRPGKLLAAAHHAGWDGGGGICYDATPTTVQAAVPGPRACYYGAVAAGRQVQPPQGLQSSCVGQLAAAPASGPMTMPMYGAQADASESGVTFGDAQAREVASCNNIRKRKRVAEQPQLPLAPGVAAHLQQQLVDVDRLVLQHTARIWAELTEQRRRHARQVVAAVEAAAAKRLRAKDEEMDRLGRLNWALEERVRSLSVEAQVWRDLAQSNDTAVAALRIELQHALDAQARRGVVAPQAGGADTDDAESGCCGENDVAEEVGTETTSPTGRRCVVCGDGAAEVLILPCRHLCACTACVGAALACPACGCAKNGTICVDFSS